MSEENFHICGKCKINCCRDAKPPISLRRRQLIEAYLKRKAFSVENLFVQTSYVFPKEDAEGYCVFYDQKTRKCEIHPVKPETCVAGPITFDIDSRKRRIEWYLKFEEACPLAGILHKNEEMLKRRLKLAKRGILRLIHELDPEALRAILKIEEPETLKIDEDNIGLTVLNKISIS